MPRPGSTELVAVAKTPTEGDLDPIDPGPVPADAEPVDDPAALRSEAFGLYFRGIRFGSIALAGRLHDDRDVQETMALS